MKASIYNYIIKENDRTLFFNGQTKRFFWVSKTNTEAFSDILSNPNDYKEYFVRFIELMDKESFVVNDNVDEIKKSEERYNLFRKGEEYHLMILPTYSCNLSCWYCTQDHRGLVMDKSCVKKVKAHIIQILKKNVIKVLHLSWFGGEPLIAFDTIVDICSFAKKECEKMNVRLKNSITTNGVLLTPDKLTRIDDFGFSFFQVTIDGHKQYHDIVKCMNGKSSYNTILCNFVSALDHFHESEFILRFNYTDSNIDPSLFVSDLNSSIKPNFRNKFQISLKKVWQIKESDINHALIDSLKQNLLQSGYIVDERNSFTSCYVDSLYFNTVFPDGTVDKCDNIDPSEARGFLNNNGDLIWKENIPHIQNTIFSEHYSSPCIMCKHLPICYGPCPRSRDEMLRHNGFINCNIESPDDYWNQKILDYCHSFD